MALVWAAPPPDKLPQLIGPPEALARITTVVVGGSPPAAPSGVTYTYRSSVAEEGTDWTITLPTGTAAGDLVVLCALFNDQTNSISYPGTGWTEHAHYHTSGLPASLTLVIASKVAVSQDITDGHFDFTMSAGYGDAALVTYQISGGTPAFDISAGVSDSSTSTTLDMPSITTNYANDLVIHFYSSYLIDTTSTIEAGTTERLEGGNFGIADEIKVTAGATEVRTVTFAAESSYRAGLVGSFH